MGLDEPRDLQRAKILSLNWTVVVWLAAQTGLGIWWASNVSATLAFLTQTQSASAVRVENELRELRDDLKVKDLQIQKLELQIATINAEGWRPTPRR
jgi:hypothetical protein